MYQEENTKGVIPQCLIQGSEPYFEYRKRYQFTASNVPNIFGYGYESRQKYYKKLVEGTKIKESSYVDDMREQGVEQETIAADLFEELSGIPLIKTGLWPHETLEWLAASPDRTVDTRSGIYKKFEIGPDTPPHTIMEIKSRMHGHQPFKPGDDGYIKFWIQMQVQMQCSQADYCVYYGYSDFNDVTHEVHVVPRDDKQWYATMLPEILRFKECVDKKGEIKFSRHKTQLDTSKTVPYDKWLKSWQMLCKWPKHILILLMLLPQYIIVLSLIHH